MSRPVNVLLTSAGRRNYLVGYFRHALAPTGGRVVAIDAQASAPALAEADEAVVVPPISAPDYAQSVLAVCRSHEISLVACLNDLDLIALSPHREEFERIGAIPLFPEHSVVMECADKALTPSLLDRAGVDGPRTWLSVDEAEAAVADGRLGTPFVVKPRFGSASIGVARVHSADRLRPAVEACTTAVGESVLSLLPDDGAGRVIIQELLPGSEYGLDIANDLQGRFAGSAARRKLAMRAGETDKAETVDPAGFEEVATRLSHAVGHRGNMDVDVFVTGDRLAVLELNPRFGGGYPFSHEAGFRVVDALVGWASSSSAQGRASVTRLVAEPGRTYAKVDRLVRVG